ncbi:MAG: hypothetical protein ABI183_06515 [Polyangiaceae bacterium]
MRGAFAIVLLSLVGAVGCGDATADIQAGQHGKRLNLVSGEATSDGIGRDLALVAVHREASGNAAAVAPLYRDVAGVVLTDPKSGAQRLQQWVLSQDGTELKSRFCPVKTEGGVNFNDCLPWNRAQSLSDLALSDVGPVRSFSTYLFADESQKPVLAQVVFDMAGTERVERTCPIVGNIVDWADCSNWLALEESASALGVPQQGAFDDEVVVPYVDKQGNPQFTQQLITPSGDAAWARTCTMTDGQIPGIGGTCPFAPQVRLSALGIHFDAVQGVGGYQYTDGEARIYAQTAIAADGVSASRRLCPVTAEGVAFEQCLGWEPVDLTELAKHGSTL